MTMLTEDAINIYAGNNKARLREPGFIKQWGGALLDVSPDDW